ncbi:MAG TPA: hypothetical protein VFL79_12795 [Terriglobia bacterium]|nr:hypothetical protein [Terriglobia bacterium]
MTVWLGGVAAIEKSGGGGLTVSPAVVLWVNPPLAPVMVIVKVELDVTPPVPLTVRLVEPPAAIDAEPKAQVIPEGHVLPTPRLTVPVNPFRAFAVIV